MPNITTCSLCGKCYEETSEEETNAPTRHCSGCCRFLQKVAKRPMAVKVREFYQYQREENGIEVSARLTEKYATVICSGDVEMAHRVLSEVGIPGFGVLGWPLAHTE